MARTALDEILRADRRKMRSHAFVAQILHIVGKHLSDEDRRRNAMRELQYELEELAMKSGVEIVTDMDRAAFGLSPRGPDGWTMEEIAALEQRRLELMLAPMPPMILPRS